MEGLVSGCFQVEELEEYLICAPSGAQILQTQWLVIWFKKATQCHIMQLPKLRFFIHSTLRSMEANLMIELS